jgi:adenylate cyclase
MSSLFVELKRRNVFKVGVTYAIVAWLIAQIIAVVQNPLHLPDWFGTAIIVLLLVGFPLAVMLAWAFELTPEGVKRAGSANRQAIEADAASAGVLELATPAIDTSKQSIAVLPFVDMSPDKDQEYFADGISEELLNQLTKIRDLHVAGRTSSFHFKDKNENFRIIGEQLNVTNILEGSVRKAGNRVRITAQLIKAADGYHLWSESYDRELDDIFAIQDDIAHAVTDALSITLGVGNLGVSTRNVGAYDAYLAGRSLYNQGGRENYSRAIEQLEQAVALDPAFADAWELLATTYYNAAVVFISERAGDLFEKFETAASHAFAIAPEAVASLRAAGQLELRRHNWSATEQLLKKAIALAPSDYLTNQIYALFLKNVGRVREAIAYDQRVVKIEPLVVYPAQVLGMTHELKGDLDAALNEFERGQGLIGDRAMLNGTTLALAMTMHDRGLMEE